MLTAINRQEWVRKIQRAGELTDGVATKCVQVITRYACIAMRVSVLGLTERPVHLDQPQPRLGDLKVRWSTKVESHDLPKLGPGPLLDLLNEANPFPTFMLNPQLRVELARAALSRQGKGIQPLGSWREVLTFRPDATLSPCRYQLHLDIRPYDRSVDEFRRQAEDRFSRRVCREFLQRLGAAEHAITGLTMKAEANNWCEAIDGPWLSEELNLPVTLFTPRHKRIESAG